MPGLSEISPASETSARARRGSSSWVITAGNPGRNGLMGQLFETRFRLRLRADMGGVGRNPTKPNLTTRPDYANLNPGCAPGVLRPHRSARPWSTEPCPVSHRYAEVASLHFDLSQRVAGPGCFLGKTPISSQPPHSAPLQPGILMQQRQDPGQ